MTAVRGIIWDCDGCLIDSEILACRVAAEFYTTAGYPVTTDDFIARFAGKGKGEIADIIETEIGRRIVLDWDAKTKARKLAFERELKAIDGVAEVLDGLDIPMGIASGSDPDRLEHSLKVVGLYGRFDGRIYSSSMVANGKPAPDVFLLGANGIGVDPEDCEVIGDSIFDIMGGKAARMTALGFVGASHGSPALASRLQKAGARHVFADMRQLPGLLDSRA